MKPYILTQHDKELFGGIRGQLLFSALLFLIVVLALVFFLSSMHLFFKIWIGACILAFFIAKSLTPQKISEDSILLKIDKNGISLRFHSSLKELKFLPWESISNVTVVASDRHVDMYIDTYNGEYHFDLAKNGAIRYYYFRYKLFGFADNKRKIKCPLTTL